MKKKYGGKSKKSGVYKITNQENGKMYIGSCKCFQVRASQHLKSLKKQKHHNKHLQHAFNKYGTDAFLFEVIKVVDGDKLARTTCEQTYLDEQKDNWQGCYNIAKKTVNKQGPWSKTPEETRKKHSESTKKMWQDPEHRAKVSKANSKATKAQWKDPISRAKLEKATRKSSKKRVGKSWGSHTEEHKQKMSKVMKGNTNNKGHKQTPEQAKVSRNNLAKLKDSTKRIENLRKALGKRLTVWNIDSPNNPLFCNSIREATKVTGLSRSTIRRNLQGKINPRTKWRFSTTN